MSPELLARLAEPACFPENPAPVTVRQTHLSVVCLVGERAYKLKKPVRFSFVDFSTLEKRAWYCGEELRLNRRLCPDVYLDVVPLFWTPEGTWSFADARGEVVDYAVRMRRLPEDRLMDRLLEQGDVEPGQVRDLAERVARFHRSGPAPSPEESRRSVAELSAAMAANFTDTEPFRATVFDSPLHAAVQRWAQQALEWMVPHLNSRADAGRVVDGHGDLHARNICLTHPPAIFDCVEFSPEFRIADSATENAFMVMDLMYRRRPDLAAAYLETYIAETGDAEQPGLMPALIAYRAMVRAKVNALTSAEPELPASERGEAVQSAGRYLRLAARAALHGKPLGLIFCGLPGSGKSSLGRRLASPLGWPCLASDAVRKELAGVTPEVPLPSGFYSQEFSDRTYGEMLRRARALVYQGPAILDANFPTAARRRQAFEAIREAGAEPVVVCLIIDDETAAARLQRRELDAAGPSDADWRVYLDLKASFESPLGSEGACVIQLDGAAQTEANLNRLLSELLSIKG